MKFGASLIGAVLGFAFFVPAYAAEETQIETPAEVKQNSEKAQQQMDDVGEEATDSAHEKTEELKKDSENAQEKMDEVGKDALTETDAEKKAD